MIFQKVQKKKKSKNIIRKKNSYFLINKNSSYSINKKLYSIKKKRIRKASKKKTSILQNSNNPIKKKSKKKNRSITNKYENNNYDNIDEFNSLPYTKALKLDERNIFSIYISLIKMKIDIIPILFYPEEFTHKSLTLSLYIIDFLYSFFMNAFLYTDDVVSEKYHNNGQLNLLTTLFLTITSNIVSSIIIFLIKKLVSYGEYLTELVKEINDKYSYILTFKKLYKILKIKVFFFFAVSLISSSLMMIYIIIFCQIYKKSQNSLLINYFLGLIESLAYTLGISLIISILRYIGLKCKIIYIYRTSVYLNEKF